MEPIPRAERLIRAMDEASAAVRGLPLLSQDKVWDRVHLELDQVDAATVEARLRRIRDVVADRQRYIEILVMGGYSP
jgi:hypothetical protein